MSEKKDIFDKLMHLPGLRILEPFYQRNKDVLLYLFFGFVTFVINILCYAWLNTWLGLNELIANIIAWVAAVLVAFLTNRIWVFHAPTETMGAFFRQMAAFFAGRLVTLGIEEAILAVFITVMQLPGMPVKIIAQIIVIVLNYVISKLVIFRKKQKN